MTHPAHPEQDTRLVISDASPLISLAAAGLLGQLESLFERVAIPEAVYHEVTLAGAGRPGASAVEAAHWLQVRTVTNTRLAEDLSRELNRGEAEAIVLAVETGAHLILLDERRARAVAGRLGLSMTGVLGCLLLAKQRRLIHALKPTLDALLAEAGYRISPQLYDHVLRAAGE